MSSRRSKKSPERPTHWVEDEWQVFVNGDDRNRHVFYSPEDVRTFLRDELSKFVDGWDPLKSYRASFDVLHVVRHHRTPPGDR